MQTWPPVDALTANPTAAVFPFGEIYRNDLAAAVEVNRVATMILKAVHATEAHRRMAVRTVILLALLEKS